MELMTTKSSAEAKISKSDLEVFAKVVEKEFNDFTKTNQQYTKDFKLFGIKQRVFATHKINKLLEMNKNEFVKTCVSDKFNISVSVIKNNKVFVKCYKDEVLCLEISLTKGQMQSISEKYNIDLEDFHNPGYVSIEAFKIIISSTFMFRNPNDKFVSCKLNDLRLLKIAEIRELV